MLKSIFLSICLLVLSVTSVQAQPVHSPAASYGAKSAFLKWCPPVHMPLQGSPSPDCYGLQVELTVYYLYNGSGVKIDTSVNSRDGIYCPHYTGLSWSVSDTRHVSGYVGNVLWAGCNVVFYHYLGPFRGPRETAYLRAYARPDGSNLTISYDTCDKNSGC